MAKFTLDDIRTAAEASYGSTDITLPDGFEVRLLNPLRLTKAKRDALIAKQNELGAEVEEGETTPEQEQILADSIRIIADTATGAERLLEHFEDDLGMLVTVFKLYSEGTQAGEASGSQG